MRTTDKFVIFWGGIFSNWAMTPFEGRVAYAELRRMLDEKGIAGQPEGVEITNRLRGKRYESGEQWMMACKAWLMDDLVTLKAVHETREPKTAKALGRKVKPFDAKLWDAACVAVVTAGCIAKFTSSDRMRAEILETGKLSFVEGSPYDTVWGIGIEWRSSDAEDPRRWKGRNLLGKCLDAARDTIARREPA